MSNYKCQIADVKSQNQISKSKIADSLSHHHSSHSFPYPRYTCSHSEFPESSWLYLRTRGTQSLLEEALTASQVYAQTHRSYLSGKSKHSFGFVLCWTSMHPSSSTPVASKHLQSRRTKMATAYTGSMLRYRFLDWLSSAGRQNTPPESNGISQSFGLTTHFQRAFFLPSFA